MSAFSIRTYRDDDLSSLVALINASDRVDGAGFATTQEALVHRLAMPECAQCGAVYLAEQDGAVVGWVLLTIRREQDLDRFPVLGIVHPDHRRHGIGTALMRSAEGRARQLQGDKPAVLEMPVRECVSGARELALSLAMQPVRCFYYMECQDLAHLVEPVLPEGVRLRTYVVGQDEEAFVPAYNDGFSDHWGYVPHTPEGERHRLSQPGFRAEDTLLAVDATGRIAGLCIILFQQMDSDLSQGNPPMIDDLAVTHAYRRHGLGRALLLAGMHRIRDLGFSACALAVDAENPNQAMRLYESVGFRIASRSTAFRKELAA